MPELVPTWRRLTAMLGDDPDAATTLALWNLPPFLTRCSHACLLPPLYASRFGEGFGTLYTAEYRPGEGVARYYWPGQAWEHSLDRLGPGRIEVRLGPA